MQDFSDLQAATFELICLVLNEMKFKDFEPKTKFLPDRGVTIFEPDSRTEEFNRLVLKVKNIVDRHNEGA